MYPANILTPGILVPGDTLFVENLIVCAVVYGSRQNADRTVSSNAQGLRISPYCRDNSLETVFNNRLYRTSVHTHRSPPCLLAISVAVDTRTLRHASST